VEFSLYVPPFYCASSKLSIHGADREAKTEPVPAVQARANCYRRRLPEKELTGA
jgi:hypothetical protein